MNASVFSYGGSGYGIGDETCNHPLGTATLKRMFSRLYPILDVASLKADDTRTLLSLVCRFAEEIAASGVNVLQYRAKSLSSREILAHGRELRRILPASIKLIMNDRADLALAAGFDGVHVGQDDLPAESVRGILGPERLLGVSTHNPQQFAAALMAPADYLAIGPVFGTQSKENPDPVVGLELVRAARTELDRRGDCRPLIAIGGINRANARHVIEAGADSVAVIGDLLTSPRHSAEEFLSILL